MIRPRRRRRSSSGSVYDDEIFCGWLVGKISMSWSKTCLPADVLVIFQASLLNCFLYIVVLNNRLDFDMLRAFTGL